MLQQVDKIQFPKYTGVRCLMMPYIQGDKSSVPQQYCETYGDIIEKLFFKKGDIGYLTIDESPVVANTPHRGTRSKFGRALHTEAGVIKGVYGWGGGTNTWGGRRTVTLDSDVKVLLANNIDDTCALWDAHHENTSVDGDIGNFAEQYPYEQSVFMKKGEVYQIGILTPHESLPVVEDVNRQFLRIISSGVHGRESYFTVNPLMN